MVIGKEKMKFNAVTKKWHCGYEISGCGDQVTIEGLWEWDNGIDEYYIKTASGQRIYIRTVEED